MKKYTKNFFNEHYINIYGEDTKMFSMEEIIFIKGTLPRTFMFYQ